eukprot:5877667-Amphidinium_carterae.3
MPLTKSDVLHNMHVAVESLRNSAYHLHANVMAHLVSSLEVHAESTDVDDACAFWSLLGVNADKIDLIARMDPWWNGTALLVNQVSEEDAMLAAVSLVVFYLIRWQNCTESRWLSMSTSAFGVLTSIAVGLDNIVDITRREGKRLVPDVRLFLAVAAVLGVLINELVLDIMADDRLLLHVDRFRATLRQATEYIEHLPDVVWTRLAIMIMAPVYVT